MVRFVATKPLCVEMTSTREQFVGADGEDHGCGYRTEDVPAGEPLSPEQVIEATKTYFRDGKGIVFTDEDGRIIDDLDDDVAATVQTQLDVWLADGSVRREED